MGLIAGGKRGSVLRYLSRRMPLGRGFTGWVVERPGLHLSEKQIDDLIAGIKRIAGQTLKSETLDYGIFADKSSNTALKNSILTVIYDKKQNEMVGFNCMPLLDIEVQGQTQSIVHLGLVMVDPDTRSRGVTSLLYGLASILWLIRNQFRPIWISSVTQVPAVVGQVSELYSNTFPTPHKSSRRSFTHLQIARRIMKSHRAAFGVGEDAEFDDENFVIRNAYTGGSDNLKKTFEVATKHRKAAYNEMCEQMLDYDRGDDFLQIGVLNGAAVRHYFLRKDPDSPWLVPLMAIIGFTFQALFLPLIYWFNSSKAWGDLRPWGQKS